MQPYAPEPPQPPQQVEQAQQQETPPPPPPPPKPPPQERRDKGLGFGAALGVGVATLDTHLDTGTASTFAGGAFLHLSGSGYSDNVSASLRLSGFIGGGTGGLESMVGAHGFIGSGGAIGDRSQVFTRLGFDYHSLKNDEADASITTVPAFQVGVQSWQELWGFELAPRIGLVARTEYEPGDESEGRRHWRRLELRAGGGASALFVFDDLFLLDATWTHVVDSDPVEVVDGRLCVIPGHFGLCGFGQYWRSVATVPSGADAPSIPTLYLGGSLVFGAAESGRQKIF